MLFRHEPLLLLTAALLLSLGWLVLNHRTFNDFFSPFNLLLIVWVLPFVSGHLGLSGLQQGLSPDAEALVVACLVIAGAICLLSGQAIAGSGLWLEERNWNTRRLSWIGAFLLVCGTAKYLAEFSGEPVPLMQYLQGVAVSSIAHRVGKDSPLQVVAVGLVAAGMAAYWAALESRNLLSRMAWLTAAAVPVIFGILKASKSDVFEPLFCYFVLSYYRSRFVRRVVPVRSLLATVAVSCVLAVGLTSVRMTGLAGAGEERFAQAIDFGLEDWPDAVREPLAVLYGYTSLGFENLSLYMDLNHSTLRIGTSMFRPFLSMVRQGEVADKMLSDTAVENLSPAANVGTFLRDLYIEGGSLLCVLGTACYSLLVSAFYVNFRSQRTRLALMLYVSSAFPWSWLFFTNAFSVLTTYLGFLYILALAWLLSETSRPARQARMDYQR